MINIKSKAIHIRDGPDNTKMNKESTAEGRRIEVDTPLKDLGAGYEAE